MSWNIKMPRHDPDEVISIKPGPKPERFTRIQELRANPGWMHRNEIFMVYLESEPEGRRQRWVYACKDGSITGDGVPYLTLEEHKWCMEESARVVQTYRQYPEYACMLV